MSNAAARADGSRLAADERELARVRHLLGAHFDVHELMAREAPLQEVLAELVRGIETQSDGMLGSVLLYDPLQHTLHHGAAPSLPLAYSRAIDGAAVGPDVGSCGSAAHANREVIVEDIQTDPRWVDFRELAGEHGLQACWSVPVRDAAGSVLGTFALYYTEPRAPRASELQLIRQASRLAALAIERHRSTAELKRLATRDQLTDLPNRALLRDRLEQALARSGRTGSHVAVAFCDLDRFTLLNDSLGHALGDWTLREVASRLLDAIRPGDTVARYGGDEFVVIADGVRTGDAEALAERLHDALEQPFVHPESGEIAASVTIGVALADANATVEDALRRADSAVADAKRSGVPTRIYSRELRERATERLALHRALRGAAERGELRLAYQPMCELESGRICAAEALMRWQHPELGAVSPARFIPVAEENGRIVELGAWALASAIAECRRWQDAGHGIAVSVNLSSRQLADAGLARRVERELDAAGLDPGRLWLEVTETALIDQHELAARSLEAITELGVRVALDDFGTGWSSFARLRRLPIAALKIDREFVAGLGTDADADATAIVAAMVGAAHGLGLYVTAEGVETPAQLARVCELGCTHAQGYLLGRPVESDALAALLAEHADRGLAPLRGADRAGADVVG